MERERLATGGLAIAVVALIVLGMVALATDEGDDAAPAASGATDTSPTTAAPDGSGQQPPGPLPGACTLVSVDAVAKVTGKRPTEVEPQAQSGGSLCRYKSPEEGGVALVDFVVLVQEASFARETTEARQGERVPGLGDVAVFDRSEFKSELSVAKGNRYVQLSSTPKSGAAPASKDALVEIARQAVTNL